MLSLGELRLAPKNLETPPAVVVGDHDPAHARFPSAVAFQLPARGIFALDHTVLDRSRELRRRHRRRFRERNSAGHYPFLLSVDFSIPFSLSRVFTFNVRVAQMCPPNPARDTARAASSGLDTLVASSARFLRSSSSASFRAWTYQFSFLAHHPADARLESGLPEPLRSQ